MQVGILGSGDVGQALGTGLVGLGDVVMMGSRDPRHAQAWVERNGALASAGSYAQAAAFGELLVLAVPGEVVAMVLEMAGSANFAGKVVIDATNPITSSQSQSLTLFVGGADSLGERIQRAIPAARVVKAFNIVGHALMVHPDLPGGPPDMFFCGNDADAKATVQGILTAFGWDSFDIGDIDGARYLEPMAMLWVRTAIISGVWKQAFKMLRG